MKRQEHLSTEENGSQCDRSTTGDICKQQIRTITTKASQIVLASLFTVCCGLVLSKTTAAQQYQVSYLDDLGGSSRGSSINNRGWVAGFSLLTGNQSRHATLWRDGSILDLGTLGGSDKNSSVVWPVKNNRGIIAGISQTDEPEVLGENWSCSAFFSGPKQFGHTCLGFVWDSGVKRELLPLPGGHNSFATGADNIGQVVGWAENGVHDPTCVAPQVLQFRPVIWGPGTEQIRDLPLIAGDTSGAATAINNRGQIVGISGICDQAVGRYSAKHAVLWDNGGVVDIGNLGVELWNTPMAINNHGDIAGFFGTDPTDLDGNYLRGFVWSQKEGIREIAPLPLTGHISSQANGINERGQVVGFSCTLDSDCRAFLWENGVLKNINDLVAPGFSGVLLFAQDINDQGEITGRAFDPATGLRRAFVAVPVANSQGQSNVKTPLSASRARIVLPEKVKQSLRQQRGLGSLSR
jgi:probable HAF family extracellular repeat protein